MATIASSWIVLTTLLSVLAGLTSASKPLPPSQDPWYTAPKGYEAATPGSVLRVRQAPGNLTRIFNSSSAAYNVLFRTTNSLAEPAWAVTTLLLPHSSARNASARNTSALLSYQIPYNSASVNGSPSYFLNNGLAGSGTLVLSDIQVALQSGWYVNVPDFEGPLAAFLSGILEGYAVLDSLRAVQQTSFGPGKSGRTALWGYSGGSYASEWAAELQSVYAPDLKISGAALGGVPANASTSLVLAGKNPNFSGLVPAGTLGLTKQFPAAFHYLLGALKTGGKYNRTGFLAANSMNIEQDFTFYAGQNTFNYFTDGDKAIFAPELKAIYNTNGVMGYHGRPGFPLFIYKAIHDELAPISEVDALVDRYCGVGVNILYERNSIGGHLAEETNGDARALRWLKQVLTGNLHHQGCTIRNVAINITESPL